MAGGKVFISAVTSEFGQARTQIAQALRSKGWQVTVQDDFRAEPGADTLLQFLHNHVRDSDRVICVVGHRSGACPTDKEAERFVYPRVLPMGIDTAAYTQWELFFARFYNKKFSTYIADNSYPPDNPTGTDVPGLQAAYVAHLRSEGLHRTPFKTTDELLVGVLKEDWDKPVPPPGIKPGKPVVLPYPSIGALFKGRGDFFKQLRDSLTRGGQTAIFNSTALYGMGGIGKTRAAVEYAHAHIADYDAILFAEGDTPETLRRNLASLSATLMPEIGTADEGVHLAAVLDWLATHPNWLVILDNLDSKDALAEAEKLFAHCHNGHLILTSRLSNFAAQIAPLELGLLSDEEAVAFLMERTQGRRRAASDDDAKALELAQELGGLALALEHAGAFIAKDRLTFAQYLAQWRANAAKVMAWSDAAVTHYPRAVAITWQTSIERLTPAGLRLLQRLAFLSPEPIPEFLLDAPCPNESDDQREALSDLAAYSLVTRDAEGPFFLVHRLVQEVTRQSMDEALRRQRLEEALGWVNGAFVGDPEDVRFWPQLEPLVPHARAVVGFAVGAEIAEPTARLMNQIANLLLTKALHAQAEPLMRRALVIIEKSLGPDHPIVATCLNNLCSLLEETGHLTEAEPLMRRALVIDETSFGPDHPNVAIRLSNLAQLLQDTNRLDEAEPLMRRALVIDETSFGPDHPNVAIRLSNLAQLLQDTNRLDEAEPMMRRALTIDEKSYGPDHPKVGIRLNNLAQLLKATGRLDEAGPMMRRALTIDEKSYGPDHPNVAIRLSNLAQLLQDTNRLDEAEPMMRRALTIDEKSYGPDHPKVAIRLSNLAQLLQDTNRLDEAEPLMRRALVIDEKSFGPDHPDVAINLNNLAQLLQETGRLDEAEPMMRRALAIFADFNRKTGHRHPHFEVVSNNYASLLRAMGRTEDDIRAALEEATGFTFERKQ